MACEAAVGKRDGVYIYGTDYPTRDGTGVRDYIHVEDLASAHLDALRYLEQGGESVTLNCGYEHGCSVREVLDVVQRLSPKPFKVTEADRRPGDPPSLIASVARIRSLFDWTPKYDDLEQIVQSSLNWELKRSPTESVKHRKE